MSLKSWGYGGGEGRKISEYRGQDGNKKSLAAGCHSAKLTVKSDEVQKRALRPHLLILVGTSLNPEDTSGRM